MNNTVAQIPNKSNSVLVRLGTRFGIDPDKMLGTLKATAFKGDVSTEQMLMLLVVAEQHNLNPFTKEIYAFPSRAGIVPIVSVDGWARIINESPQFDGMDFEYGPAAENGIPESVECKMYRKDRSHPVCVTEFFAEVNRNTDPWKSHPRRMLRHKAMIQCARLAFGFAGIYDEDEGERVREAIDVTPTNLNPRPDLAEVNYELRDQHVKAIQELVAELGSDETKLAPAMKDYHLTHLNPFHELAVAVQDKLVADDIMTRSYYRKLVS